MNPPIFQVCKASSAVTALIGSAPCRLFLHGHAPEGVAKPYAVWQIISGRPENYLGTLPDADAVSIQVDVYADTASSAIAVLKAIRDAIEPVSYVTRWGATTRDPETLNYRATFGADWIVSR